MIGRIIEMIDAVTGRVDEKVLVLIMLILVVVMFICGVVAVITLDKDNDEMRMIIEGLLKEKRAMEEEKNRCQK